MSKKFHINNEGNAFPCGAQEDNCPYGDSLGHYASADHARLAYELSMRYGADTMPLFQILDTDELVSEIQNNYVQFRVHPNDDSLRVLCYTKNAQYDGHWTEATKVARGLLVRTQKEDFSDAIVVERPWRKFFTFSQLSDTEWVLGDEEREGDSVEAELARIDFSLPAETTDKADGSLGILYRAPDGLPSLSTKGSFNSDQANHFTDFMRRDEKMLHEMDSLLKKSDTTHLFELVGPEMRIVLPYEKDDVIFLGGVNKRTGGYLSPNGNKNWSGTVTETMKTKTVAEALSLPDRAGREGVVIRILSDDPSKQMQLKVKQDEYKKLHHYIDGATKTKDVRDALQKSNITPKDIQAFGEIGVDAIPELKELFSATTIDHPWIEEQMAAKKERVRKVLEGSVGEILEAQKMVESLPDSDFEHADAKKRFAEKINKSSIKNKGVTFAMFDRRLQGRDVSETPVSSFIRKAVKELL